jgi:hypothetical protein
LDDQHQFTTQEMENCERIAAECQSKPCNVMDVLVGYSSPPPSPPSPPTPPPPTPPSPSPHHCDYPMNCYNPGISVPCNDIVDEFTCTANGGQWEPWSPAPGPVQSPTPTPPSPSPHHCDYPMNCYNPGISVPCNDIVDEFTCTANGGQWEPWGPAPGPSPSPAPTGDQYCRLWSCTGLSQNNLPDQDGDQAWLYFWLRDNSPSPSPSPSPSGHHCTPPDNCYHSQWAVPCSDAANEYACQQSGGVWEGSPSPAPHPLHIFI